MANTDKFLDAQGLERVWDNVKSYVDEHSGGGGGGGHTNLTITLATAGWNTTSKTQSYTVTGVTTDSLAIVTSVSDDSVILDSLSANTMVFKYTGSSVPSGTVTAYVTVFK